MRYSVPVALLLMLALSGCELVAKFDRNKIPPPDLMRPDANLTVKPVDDPDAGKADAAMPAAEGGLTDGGLTDGGLTDGETPSDAALDGGVVDAVAP